MLQFAVLAVSALTTGYAVGRKAIVGELDKRKKQTIQEAAEAARDQIRGHASAYLTETLREYAIVTGIKAALLAAFWAAWKSGIMPGPVFSVAIAILLALFIARDMFVTWPTARMILMELRRHGWNPKRALSEIVAAEVFEQVIEEATAKAELANWRERMMLSIAGQKRDALTVEIAGAVAHIARQTSWADLRPFIIAAAIKATVLAVLYSGFVFLLLTAGRG